MIRGKTRAVPQIKTTLNASIHNRFDIEVIDSRTGKVKQRAQAENVILSTTYAKMGTVWFNYIHYGSGSGTPAVSDTSLFTFRAAVSASNLVFSDDTTNHVYKAQKSIVLSETTAVGTTLTEVGIGSGSGASTLCTHAMLKDMNGNQISIAKTDTDIINIYATVFVKYSNVLDYGIGTGLLKMLTGCILYYSDGSGWTDAMYISGYNGSSVTTSYSFAKDGAAKTITYTMTRLAAGVANYRGIKTIRMNTAKGGDFFTLTYPNSWYSGSNIVGEAVGTGDGTTTAFPTVFPYASSATIYVDGVAQSGVTVTNQSALGNNIVFNVAPATGAVITADYHTSIIAKDANHVFDLTVLIQIGEYAA